MQAGGRRFESDYLHETKGRQTNRLAVFLCSGGSQACLDDVTARKNQTGAAAPGGLLFQVPPRSGCRMPLAESDYLHRKKSSTAVGDFFCGDISPPPLRGRPEGRTGGRPPGPPPSLRSEKICSILNQALSFTPSSRPVMLAAYPSRPGISPNSPLSTCPLCSPAPESPKDSSVSRLCLSQGEVLRSSS